MGDQHDHFMAIAIEEAKLGLRDGEQPFGAVVVFNGTVVSRTRSLKVSTFDPTAHAETLAVQYACKKLQRRVLSDCRLYTTCEPCPMCCGAILNAGVSSLIIGARKSAVRLLPNWKSSFHNFTIEKLLEITGCNLEIIYGVLQNECIEMYRNADTLLTR
tara:strand:+ start:98 stop:574 length:477 start_codon:yes stop_codon:yes gene_type:complete